MLTSVERMLAFKFLRAKRKEGFISVIAIFSFLGISLGVATLIVVMAVFNGFRVEITKYILGMNAHVTVSAAGAGLNGYDAVIEQVRALPEVTEAVPVVEGQVLGTANGMHRGVYVRGMRKDDLLQRKVITENIRMGSLEAFGEENTALIGSRLAHGLNLVAGDTIRLISPQAHETIAGPIPRIKDYTVAAIVEMGMFEYDNILVYLSLEAAQSYFRLASQNAVSQVEVMVADPTKASEIGEKINALLQRNYDVLDWQEANKHYFERLKVERVTMFFILAFIILIAAFNILSGLVMLVIDKQKEVAILRTMGLSRGAVMRVFFTVGMTIGAVGTLLGVGLGVAFATHIEEIRQWLQSLTGTDLFAAELYYLSQLPAEFDPRHVVITVSLSLGLSFLATLYPSWKAAGLEPVEGLRYE